MEQEFGAVGRGGWGIGSLKRNAAAPSSDGFASGCYFIFVPLPEGGDRRPPWKRVTTGDEHGAHASRTRYRHDCARRKVMVSGCLELISYYIVRQRTAAPFARPPPVTRNGDTACIYTYIRINMYIRVYYSVGRSKTDTLVPVGCKKSNRDDTRTSRTIVKVFYALGTINVPVRLRYSWYRYAPHSRRYIVLMSPKIFCFQQNSSINIIIIVGYMMQNVKNDLKTQFFKGDDFLFWLFII